mmetsp:Transcript_44383/g.96585  ORF Transcript_44383/g.96585 Transcript_44383/m.96585 type:complete len:248 (+) Transcript_44383:302-1045(+)
MTASSSRDDSMASFQSETLVMCFFSSSTISVTGAPGRKGSPEVVHHTVCKGDLSFFAKSLKSSSSFSRAGFMRGEWKAWLPSSVMSCAPSSSAMAFRAFTPASLPETVTPLGKQFTATSTASSAGNFFITSLHIFWTFSSSRPTTDISSCSEASTISCWITLRVFTKDSISSKEQQPAAHNAEYMPMEKPTKMAALSTTSAPSWSFITSRATMFATNMPGLESLTGAFSPLSNSGMFFVSDHFSRTS